MAVTANPRGYCLRLLKTRLRSRNELERALARRNVEPERREEVLDELAEIGLIDDLRFARSWVHTRDRLAPRGERLLRQELQQRGIGKELIDSVLKERSRVAEDQPSEIQMGREVLEHRARQFAGLDPAVRARRQIALLQRRGFSYGTIKRILEA